MAKFLEMKAESLEKLNHNLASETARKTENSWQHMFCIQVSNYPFDMCKLGALFWDNFNKLKRAKFVFLGSFLCYIPFPAVFNFIIMSSFIQDLY